MTKFEDTCVEGFCNSDSDDNVLFTTIPYENGWNITVNGKTVKPEKSLDSLITIPLEKGKNRITMNFSPNYFKGGIIVSIFGVVMLIIVFVFEYRGGKLYKKIISRLSDESPKTADNASNNNNTETLIEPNEKQIIDKINSALEENMEKTSENDSNV